MSQGNVACLVALLVCVSGVAVAGGPTSEKSPSPPAAKPVALGDVLLQIPAGTATGDSQLLGVEFAFGHYWVTGGNSSADPNRLYKIDATGALVGTYEAAAACTGWGGRDLASDGTYLYYGCDDGLIYQVDPTTGAPTGVTIPDPITPARALAYAPSTDHFWVANWDSTIYEIDRTGTTIHSFAPVGLSTYGLAWDPWSPGGPYLWAWSQDGTDPLLLASQINPTTGALTGISFSGVGLAGEMAGGAGITIDIPSQANRVCLVTMSQASSDTIVVYDLNFVVPVELSSFTIE